MIWLWGLLAVAAVPEDVRPVLVVKAEAPEGALCRAVLGDEVLVCAGRPGEKGLSLLTADGDEDAVWAELRRRAGKRVQELAATPVRGGGGTYYATTDTTGWAALPLLAPEVAAARLGTPNFLVAVPARGLALVWPAGDPQLDTIMAVGVREMHDSWAHPLSAQIYRWDGTRYVVFAEAKPRQP